MNFAKPGVPFLLSTLPLLVFWACSGPAAPSPGAGEDAGSSGSTGGSGSSGSGTSSGGVGDSGTSGDAATGPSDASVVPPSDGGPGGCGTSTTGTDAAPAVTNVFTRALISRAYEQQVWVLRGLDGGANREDVASTAATLAGLRPSYVSGLVYLENGTAVTAQMIDDYGAIRAAARAASPDVKLDVEISLNPSPPSPKQPFADAAALVAQMTTVDCLLHPDAWMFDFYSDAQKVHPDWIAAAVAYAHSHGQLVGGNVFNGTVPPGSDFVAFVDDPVDGGVFGFDFNRTEIARLRQSSPSTQLVGHLQSNPQNGPTTESCVYSLTWDEPTRAAYLSYWASSQTDAGFAFFYPVFYPLCPGAVAFDSTKDPAPDGGTLYDSIDALMSRYNP